MVDRFTLVTLGLGVLLPRRPGGALVGARRNSFSGLDETQLRSGGDPAEGLMWIDHLQVTILLGGESKPHFNNFNKNQWKKFDLYFPGTLLLDLNLTKSISQLNFLWGWPFHLQTCGELVATRLGGLWRRQGKEFGTGLGFVVSTILIIDIDITVSQQQGFFEGTKCHSSLG